MFVHSIGAHSQVPKRLASWQRDFTNPGKFDRIFQATISRWLPEPVKPMSGVPLIRFAKDFYPRAKVAAHDSASDQNSSLPMNK